MFGVVGLDKSVEKEPWAKLVYYFKCYYIVCHLKFRLLFALPSSLSQPLPAISCCRSVVTLHFRCDEQSTKANFILNYSLFTLFLVGMPIHPFPFVSLRASMYRSAFSVQSHHSNGDVLGLIFFLKKEQILLVELKILYKYKTL